MAAKQELSAKVADILMVVDSGEDRNSLVEILVNDGYKPRQFEDSQLALEAAFAQPPSLILLDVKILGMSSYEFCQSLKKDERTRDVPIIFAGKLDELQDCIHKFEIMGIDFICKPLHEAEVLLRVKNHLRLREVQFHLKELVAERTAELQRLLHEHSLELSSAREQIRVFFESSPLGLALTNFAGQFLEVNKSLADMLRTTEASLLQRNASDVYVDPRQRVQLLNQLREKGRLQDFTVHILRDDGNTFESYTSVHGLGKGGVSGLAVSDEMIWVATGFDTITEFGSFQAGGGLAYSEDDGMTWNYINQPDAEIGIP